MTDTAAPKDWRGYIEVTGIAHSDLIRAAYDISRAQGLGILHFVAGPMPDEMVERILEQSQGRSVLSTDYVLGRAMKFNIWMDGDKSYIAGDWYDHTEAETERLLVNVGHPDPAGAVAKAKAAGEERQAERA